jgi:hypothetical protein
VSAPAFKGIEVEGQGGRQGFALAGFHFSDHSLVKNDPADELYVEMPHAQGSDRGFSDGGKSFGKDVIQGFSLLSRSLNSVVFNRSSSSDRLKIGLQLVDLIDQRGHFFESPLVLAAKNSFNNFSKHDVLPNK